MICVHRFAFKSLQEEIICYTLLISCTNNIDIEFLILLSMLMIIHDASCRMIIHFTSKYHIFYYYEYKDYNKK